MPWWIWTLFILLISALVLLDLGVLNRRAHRITFRESIGWTTLWVTVALSFTFVVYFLYKYDFFDNPYATGASSGSIAAMQYLVGYLVEYSLSIDNIFVIAVIMTTLSVPAEHQHRLLFWGVLTAVVLRGVMIIGGAALIARFEWTIYLFGALLILSAIRLLQDHTKTIHPDRHILVRCLRKFFPVSGEYHGRNFFTVINGKRYATPMFVALLLIESCDVMFAVDSIPAVFGITRDPFIVFTSNIFAILGLRSLYFALAGLMHKFDYLKLALIALLLFIGIKMLLSDLVHIDKYISLGVIVSLITIGVSASLLFGNRSNKRGAGTHPVIPGESISENVKEEVHPPSHS